MPKRINDIKIALALSVFGILAGLSLGPNLSATLSQLNPEQTAASLPFPLLVLISSIQLGVVALLAGWAGVKLARRTQLQLPILDALLLGHGKMKWDARWLTASIVCGVAAGFLIIGSDKFIFSTMNEVIRNNPPEASFFNLLAGVLYGGVFEEVLLRLFVMSLFVWLLAKIFVRDAKPIPKPVYGISILAAAALFALGHLPATEMVFGGLTPVLVIRSFILNGIAGIAFGYLFWKKGIEYSMISHMTAHVSMQLLFIPALYSI